MSSNMLQTPIITTFGKQERAYQLPDNAILQVYAGKVTLEADTNTLRCGEHGIRLVFNFLTGVCECPSCATSAALRFKDLL